MWHRLPNTKEIYTLKNLPAFGLNEEWEMHSFPRRTTFILVYKSIFIKVLDGNLGSFNLYLYHISDSEGR